MEFIHLGGLDIGAIVWKGLVFFACSRGGTVIREKRLSKFHSVCEGELVRQIYSIVNDMLVRYWEWFLSDLHSAFLPCLSVKNVY